MRIPVDLTPEYILKRIPFLRKFENHSGPNAILFDNITYNSNVEMYIADESYIFPNWNLLVRFRYTREQINDNYFFHFNVDPELIVTKPKNMESLLYTTLNIMNRATERKYTLFKEIISKEEHLTPEQLNQVFNEINKVFFELEEQFNAFPDSVKSPLNESAKQKLMILESLRNLPQDYSDEFNQTGSGKSIQGKPNLPNASKMDVAKIKAKITQAHQVAKAYREAYQKGLDSFQTQWQGSMYTCKIPKSFREKNDYLYYFDYPNVGDGGFQVSMDKTGFLRAKHIRAKSDMDQNPNLAAATDAGYQKDYEGRTKYFFVQAGIKGKYQQDGYSVFPTPAIDAAIKTLISFQTDIIDFMSGTLGYTSDTKGKDLANQMNLEDKIKKVRLDAERLLNVDKSLAFNPIWSEFRDLLFKKYAGTNSLFDFDIDSEVEDFVQFFKNKNPFNKSGKPELSMPKDEMDAWEKEQKEKLARLAAARAKRLR